MTAYEELVDRCYDAFYEAYMATDPLNGMRKALAEVLRTLETVTPAMLKAWEDDEESTAHSDWLCMLHASPLSPP